MTPAADDQHASALPVLTGISAVADGYDALVLDLWGCVHNGLEPFPGVPDLLRRLKQRGQKVLMLSNAPRRAAIVAGQLERNFGIAPDLYDAVLTSGEVAWQALKRRDDAEHAALGRRCLHLGPERDLTMFEGNDLVRVTDVADADFLLATGPNDDRIGVEPHEALLREGARRALPLVCANPDLEVIRGEARLICAGALAERYEALGGPVIYHGKPHAVTYRVALHILGGPVPRRVLAVGDGLRTDIVGAARAGLDSAFIPGGIHGEELGIQMGEAPAPQPLAALLARFDAHATYILPELRW